MKKHLIALFTGASLCAAAGIACATDVNFYGSSAQYPYWSAQASDYAKNKLGCTDASPATQSAVAPAGTSGVSCYAIAYNTCTNTSLVPDGKFTLRYCSNNSITGVQSIAGSGGDPDGCGDNFKRKMINADGTTSCQTVNAGVADVAGESFTQNSTGVKLGPMGGSVVSPSYSGVSTTGLTPNNTVVVPFGFFVNKSVTATQCTAGLVGNLCTANSQCNTTGNNDGICSSTPTTITNLSRMQAAMLFSGQVADWSQFGAYYTANPVVLCLRHAGSGTHATLDYAVMSAGTTGWGAQLVNTEDQVGPPQVWFNNGSTDEIKCVNGNNSVTAATPNGSLVGAIGYADADQAIGVANTSNNVAQLKYNGFYPTRTHIRNGEYDFYGPSWLYYNNGHNPSSTNLIKNIVTYAQDPSHVPASKVNYWAALSEMQFMKDSDKGFPYYNPGANLLTP